MDTQTVLNNPDAGDAAIDLSDKRTKKEIIKGVKQNFKFLTLVNPFFSCKSEDEYGEYKKQLHTLLDETITMRLALFTRCRRKD